MKSPITIHPASWQTNYVSPPGNHAGAVTMPVQTTTAYRRGDGLPTATWFFLARIEVMAPAADRRDRHASATRITDGTASTIDTNNRWPDHLARRLATGRHADGRPQRRLRRQPRAERRQRPGALARFDRDVIAQPGVTHVIVLEGINDIGQARQNASPSAADLIAAHKQMIERAHARGLKIFGATLTPFEGANYWTRGGRSQAPGAQRVDSNQQGLRCGLRFRRGRPRPESSDEATGPVRSRRPSALECGGLSGGGERDRPHGVSPAIAPLALERC